MDSVSHLPSNARADVSRALVLRVMDALDLFHAAKTAHWCVRGMSFLPLHAFFDTMAAFAEKQADILAERATALGGHVDATTQAIAANTSLPPYPRGLAVGAEHVAALAEQLRAYVVLLRDTAGVADAVGDLVTVNLLTDAMGEAEKIGWMLLAHLHQGISS